tara:strand:- start:1594 stop:2202 length:609 start_codon:yes stop_codon:yes gene_type:complete
MSNNRSQKYTKQGKKLLGFFSECIEIIKSLRQVITNQGVSSENFKIGKTNLTTKVLDLLTKIKNVQQEFKNEVIELMTGLNKNNLPSNLQNYKTSVKPTPIMKMDTIIAAIKKAMANRAAAAASRGRTGVKKAVVGVKMGMRLKKNANKTRQTELNNLNILEKQLGSAKKNIGNNNSNMSNRQGQTGYVNAVKRNLIKNKPI